MKQVEAVRSTEPKTASQIKPVGGQKPAPKKPAGPMTYTVPKGSDVFWSVKRIGKA